MHLPRLAAALAALGITTAHAAACGAMLQQHRDGNAAKAIGRRGRSRDRRRCKAVRMDRA